MKNIYFISIILLILVACSKEEPPAPGEKTDYPGSTPPPSANDGQLMIYRVDTCGDGSTIIYLDGEEVGTFGSIYYFDHSCSDDISSNVGIKINKAPGTYTLSANTSGFLNYWEGDVIVYEQACTKAELRCGGMITGDAFTSINATGSWCFFVDENTCFSSGPTQIEIWDDAGSFSTSSWPTDESYVDCSVHDEDGANFTLPPGDYSFRADELSSPYRYWEDSFTISAGDCQTYRLWCN